MTKSPTLSPLVVNEVRALAPAWLLCAAAMIAGSRMNVWPLSEVGVGAYPIGVAALGGLSLGHDYMHRTLPVLLSLPQRRDRVFLVKWAVLGMMLVTLAALAYALVFPRIKSDAPVVLMFTLLAAVAWCVAPWLTMACRSAIAGTVFTLALPGTLLTITELVYLVMYHRFAPGDRQSQVMWRGTIACCAVGAVMSWRTFMRLEAMEDGGAVLGLPSWLRRDGSLDAARAALTKRHPIRLLVAKELRLQQMPFVVAGLYVVGWVAAVSTQDVLRHAREVFNVLSVLYGFLVALLIGAVASAEERQMGTLSSQLLLPISWATQWIVKVGIVLVLSLLLAVGLPLLLNSTPFPALMMPRVAFTVVALALAGLYVSSASSSGLWAMLMSLAAALGTLWGLTYLRLRLSIRLGRIFDVSLLRFDNRLELSMAAAFLALLVGFAFTNHRSMDRASRRIWVQALWLAGYLTVATIVAVLAGWTITQSPS